MSRFSLRPFLLVGALLVSAPANAEEKPKPNELTQKEMTEGWLQLFDGETAFGWDVTGDSKIADGLFLLGAEKATTATCKTPFAAFELYFETLDPILTPAPPVLALTGTATTFDLLSAPKDVWVHHRLIYDPSARRGELISDAQVKKQPDYKPLKQTRHAATGSKQLVFRVPAKHQLTLRNIKIKPLGMIPLFNGKDLIGWKNFAGEKYKSAFSVTNEGWLNVKNGPGDLQTDGKYDDFVLQLECISNGKALNSGIFFRCLPDQYQNGYEAQIQNGFKDGDRTKPADFGTGAIYRRIAARKVVSNDNEWFSMTVAAQGKHIATWVNGYQTVDWTDDRPPDENPRKGSKIGKGHISIQGHDPTTDLSFRNIRITELK